MKKIFGIDSKAMQFLGTIGDLILLNVLFILCSIPIFTMGAAWSGLYSAVRALRSDYNGEKSCYGAFFDGFKNGFWRVTIPFVIFFVVAYLLTMVLVNVYVLKVFDSDAPVAMSIVGLSFILLFVTMIPLFHSKFECTGFQLVRNAVVMIICNPITTLLLTVLTWIPLIVLLADVPLFMQITPLWFLGYYSLVAYLGIAMFHQPFRILEDNFNETHGGEEKTLEQTEE